jgi:hypothetical protein
MTTNPWMKFYPSDWRGDAALRTVSSAARGLWMDMLSLMHEAEPYGHLLINGVAPEPESLAKIFGNTAKETRKWLAELESAGVFSRTDDGTIYSRRMVRDCAKALVDKQNGSNGGNPNIKKHRNDGVNPPPNPKVNGEDKAHIPEARNQKLESEKKERTPHTPPQGGCAGDPPSFAEFWEAYPRKVGKRAASQAYAAALKRGADPIDILDGLDRAHFSPTPRFQPHPATWLNQDRWLDQEMSQDEAILRAIGLKPGNMDDNPFARGFERELLQ